MEIYKFGGASVQDAASVKNVAEVVLKTGIENKVIVVSAMGKVTNAFELVVAGYLEKLDIPKEQLLEVKNYHYKVANDLFGNDGHTDFIKHSSLFVVFQNFMEYKKT